MRVPGLAHPGAGPETESRGAGRIPERGRVFPDPSAGLFPLRHSKDRGLVQGPNDCYFNGSMRPIGGGDGL